MSRKTDPEDAGSNPACESILKGIKIMSKSLYKKVMESGQKFLDENRELFENLTLMEELDKESMKQFPVKLRDCGDDRDENFIKRQSFRAGAMWAFRKKESK